MQFACVVSTESWQVTPHRLLDARLDLALSGVAAAFRHVDNIIDVNLGVIVLDQVCWRGLP